MGDIYSTNARWFNGKDRRPRMALVRIHGQHLELVPHSSEAFAHYFAADGADAGESSADLRDPLVPLESSARRYARALLKVGERWRGTPVPVQLPDGGTVLLSADSAVAKVLAPQSLASRMMGSWPGVVTGLLLLMVAVLWLSTVGAGWMARLLGLA
ncbi:hypothetical protein OU995_08170 [Roseateles sp. SL47]|uniref:DUF7092 domain-containing protein n=1 Tax=Roseateles sp. SL47 TaxID=2995138 RepID=UPI00226FE7F6|nr:hypothetical protein [Roseateles sp. SL47]WAC74663.1 hypothetical protein OU995_08170 [Roseateles sp. SL47]